ncbi:hypothetical protein [Pedobacter africanus]|uniref:Uncharacterized protein n=1 Tax=Pedobacter africanus TaxID=151894 RepID=A0A1W2E685_9SPHI|nr:hypothetical protein [Pedobacter africanus]SMD05244.1 hypothetical protein SAMN04488524_4452 [Pedobacter africanus]
MPLKYLIAALFAFFCTFVKAQDVTDCEKLLDTEPYFVRHKGTDKDSLLQKDIRILKHCGNFESIDSVFLKGPMLGALMLDQVRIGKPATYRTLIEYFAAFKKTLAYKDFVKGLVLYKEMAAKKVNLDNWDADKELFVRMGFTAGDLEDFKGFLAGVASENLTYKAALTRYMSEIEAMRVDK